MDPVPKILSVMSYNLTLDSLNLINSTTHSNGKLRNRTSVGAVKSFRGIDSAKTLSDWLDRNMILYNK
jgi:hypothetical protein